MIDSSGHEWNVLSQTEEIKSRIDIVDLIGDSVSLRKAGRTFKAPCPFHNERTPSFVVDPERQSWRCYGACGEGGDIFSFVMKQQNLGFRDALTQLAERANVPLAPLDKHAEERERVLDRLRSANEATVTFFRNQLLEAPGAEEARAYVERRGLNEEICETFGLGYAPPDRDALQSYLRARGFSHEEIVEAGLAVAGDRDTMDRFRDRLIFPIRDRRARCIGFGGRALGDDAGPKYLNTSQTPLFDKSGTLYAFELARESMRAADQVIIVEGYMDVIAAHQFEQRNVVAAMGTSLTEKQVALIKPVTRNIVLALDADVAGAAATLRGIDTAREAVGTEAIPVLDARGILRMQDSLAADIRVLELPEGLDPDDLIRKEPDRWSALVQEAAGYLDYRFTQIRSTHDLNNARDRAAAVQTLLPIVGAIVEPVVRSEYVARLAAVARVEIGALETMLQRRRRGGSGGSPMRAEDNRIRTGTKEIRGTGERRDKQAEFLLKLLLIRPEIVVDLPPELPTYTEDAALREVLTACVEAKSATSPEDDWRAGLDESLQSYLSELEQEAANLPPYSELEAHSAAAQTVVRLRERTLRGELRALSQGIAEEERETRGDRLTLAAVAMDGDTSVAELEAEPIDDELKAAAYQVLENRAKSRALHGRQRVEAIRHGVAKGPVVEGEG